MRYEATRVICPCRSPLVRRQQRGVPDSLTNTPEISENGTRLSRHAGRPMTKPLSSQDRVFVLTGAGSAPKADFHLSRRRWTLAGTSGRRGSHPHGFSRQSGTGVAVLFRAAQASHQRSS